MSAVACTALFSCSDALAPDGDFDVPDVRPFVTAAAGLELTDEGHFRVDAVFDDGEWGTAGLSALQRVADVYVREFVVDGKTTPGLESIREAIEQDHGAPIDWNALVGIGAGGYAVTPYARTTLQVPNFLRRPFGPFFVRSYGAYGRPVLSIAVSLLDPVPSVAAAGQVVLGPEPGGEFKAIGIPTGQGDLWPPSPEAAVVFAATMTGRKVRARPTMIRPEVAVSPVGAVWEVKLDSVVSLRDRFGKTVQTDSIYVSVWPSIRDTSSDPTIGLRLLYPTTTQPEADSLPLTAALGAELGLDYVWHPRRSGTPTRFVEVLPTSSE